MRIDRIKLASELARQKIASRFRNSTSIRNFGDKQTLDKESTTETD